MPAQLLQWAPTNTETAEEYEQRKKRLYEEIVRCEISDTVAVNKLKKFLLAEGIAGIAELDYPLRMRYAAFLEKNVKQGKRHLNAFDRVKQYAIQQQMKTLAGRQACKWQYQNQILFIPYHSDEEVVKQFAAARQMETMVWDFGVDCSEQLKRQVFEVLNHIIADNRDDVTRRVTLLALQRFYGFCVENKIADIEKLELDEVEKFYMEIRREKKSGVERFTGILNYSRKIVFVNAAEIHWDAGVWYLERLHLTAERANQSTLRNTVSFLEIRNKENRRYAQAYMKYELGVTGQAVSTICRKYQFIQAFLTTMEEKNLEAVRCKAEDIDIHIKRLQALKIQEKGFNERISAIQHFYKFLEIKGYIKQVPFHAAYYYQKVLPVHHDRSVEDAVWKEVIQKLRFFPEHLRCMFLHLWCLGLRASEVCTLKGDAYFRQSGEAWMKIHQVKMKNYKRIPIPEALYKVMQVYLEKHHIKPEDYIFQNSRGGACLYNTFRTQMLKCCKENEIENGHYMFQSHDYRHTVATLFYDSEVSIQSIRDYLGHNYEEMTRQYIDYMPKRLAKANDEYFSKPNHSLAACLKKGDSFGK
ncbi:MAG: tyrosine-type recombinase/integrase [Lachnospiraceae bacterium]|nr:tyrosine-type recombinase/integrase [Lachnospiraceae bacterium]